MSSFHSTHYATSNHPSGCIAMFDFPRSPLLPTARVWAVWSDIREAVVYCSPRKSDCVCWRKYCANGYACDQLYIVRMDLSPIYGGRKEMIR